MADSKKTSSFQYVASDVSPARLRDELLQGKAETVAVGAMTEALDLYSFMSALPDALIASQQREARRLEKAKGEKGPRLEAMQASIAQAQQLNATVRSGRARFDRAITAMLEPNDVFHGFVTGPELQMQKGYTVRLVGADGKQRHSAVTQGDGYFTMTIKSDPTRKASAIPGKDETQMAMLGEMVKRFGMRGSSGPVKGSAVKGEGNVDAELASAEVLDPRGEVVYRDPIPVDLNGGTVCREYLVASPQDDAAPRRYVGNSAKFELHDSEKLTKRCNYDAIRDNHKVYFDSTAEAEKAGYDYCAYCFGKKMSRR